MAAQRKGSRETEAGDRPVLADARVERIVRHLANETERSPVLETEWPSRGDAVIDATVRSWLIHEATVADVLAVIAALPTSGNAAKTTVRSVLDTLVERVTVEHTRRWPRGV